METVRYFIFLGPQITAYTDYSHEIKRHIHLGRKAMVYIDSVLKSRDITLPMKVCIVKLNIFPVLMCNVRVGPYRRLGTEELMFLDCGVRENS